MSSLIPPILIVGNVRSGTSMVLELFSHIETLVTWFEPRTIWKIGHVGYDHDELGEEMATPKVIRRIRKRFLRYQETHGGRRIVDKTPSNAVRIPFIHKVFPESKILHICRDGLDNVSSALPRWSRPIAMWRLKSRLKETPIWQWPYYLPRFVRDLGIRVRLVDRSKSFGVVYPGMQQDLKAMELVEVIAKQWVNVVETAQAQLRRLDPDLWMETRYEDLVAHPHEECRRLFDFFGLEMVPSLTSHLSENVHRDSVGVYNRRLTPGQIGQIVRIIRPTMERLGYTIEGTAPTSH